MLTSSVHMPLAVDTCVFARSYVFPIPAPCQVSCDSGVDTTIPLLGIPYLTPVFRPPVPRRAIVAHLYLRTLVPLPLSLALVSRARRTEVLVVYLQVFRLSAAASIGYEPCA